MFIHADFSAPAIVTPQDHRWSASPQAGVERVMLDRVGAEVARATSLVRYAPGSTFPAHQHPGGEEILVLSGTFSDEQGDYGAGWYLRNPPGSAHRPHSHPGALILVKLHQMRAHEDRAVRIDSADPAHWQTVAGREVCRLFDDGQERVSLQRLADAQEPAADAQGGLEIFIVSGALSLDGARYPGGSWLRLPPGARPALQALGAAVVFVKTGHLQAGAGRGSTP